MEHKFGISQINIQTPSWAKWFFRVVFLFNKILTAYIAATNLIDPVAKYEITLFITLIIDPLAFGFSKMFGISLEEKKEVYADDQNPPPIGGGGIENPKTKP